MYYIIMHQIGLILRYGNVAIDQHISNLASQFVNIMPITYIYIDSVLHFDKTSCYTLIMFTTLYPSVLPVAVCLFQSHSLIFILILDQDQ